MTIKIVVIGSNSFSGQDFIDLLLEDPDNYVIGVSRSPEKSELFLRYKRHGTERFRFHQIDLNHQMVELRLLLDTLRPRAIINFAAQSEVALSWEHPQDWFQTNTVALAELVTYLRGVNYLDRYVHISSPEVYGSCSGAVGEHTQMSPSTPYAASKAAADMLLEAYRRQFNFPVVTIRSTNVYGPRQQLFKLIPRSIIRMKQGKKILLHGGGRAVKSYIHIRDISRGELTAMRRGAPGEIYHLSPGTGTSVRSVVQEIAQLMGWPFDDVVADVDERPGQDDVYEIDSTLAYTDLDWKPEIGLHEGLTEVITWVHKNWAEIQKQPLEYQHKP